MKIKDQNIEELLKDKPELLFIIQVLSKNLTTDYSNLHKLDFSEFIRLIKHHRLDSIFYKAAKEQNISLPTELDAKLSQINKRNKMRMMKLTAELIRIHKLFTENNIDYISLKGPALSQQIYGDYTIRNSRDLDILVREGDFVKSSNMLKSIDYRNNKRFNAINKFNYKEFKFINNDTKILVELHHRLFNNKYLLPINNVIFKNPEFIQINGVDIPILNNKYNFEYIAIHAAAHNWSRMVWPIDILALKNKNGNLEIDKQLVLLKNTIYYNLEDYILSSDEKQLKLFGKMFHLLKMKNNSNYKLQELLQRLFIPYRYFDKRSN